MLAHGRWFSPGTPASSTTKTGCHDIAEILLKVVLKSINQSINEVLYNVFVYSCSGENHSIDWQVLSVKLQTCLNPNSACGDNMFVHIPDRRLHDCVQFTCILVLRLHTLPF